MRATRKRVALTADIHGELTTRRTGLSYRETAGYAQLQLTHLPGWLFVPAVRVDHADHIDTTSFDLRLNTEGQLTDWLGVVGGAGLFHQPPTDIVLVPELGSTDLDVERARHVSGGVKLAPLPWLRANVLGFYKSLDGLVEPTGELFPLVRNGGRGRAYGAELELRIDADGLPAPWNRLSGWVAYTLSRSERWNHDAGKYQVFVFDQPHNLVVFGAYRLPRNWRAAARFRYASGFPFFDDIAGGGLGGRLDEFHQLDFRVDKRWIHESWTLMAFFDIQNVYNRFNFSAPGGVSDSSVSPTPPGVPILPFLGLRGEF